MTGYVKGVNLLPGAGEWVYDTLKHDLITQWIGTAESGPGVPETAWSPTASQIDNYHDAPTGSVSDYTTALNQLQTAFPDCATVALVCAWFGNSRDMTACQIYPSTNHNGSMYLPELGGSAGYTTWVVSSLFGSNPLVYDSSGNVIRPPGPFPGIIPLSKPDGVHNAYGGTPSDQSVVRCIRDLKARGFRVVFYPFILMDVPGDFPWRGRIGFNSPDISSAATVAVNKFFGGAATTDFTQIPENLTVSYLGSPTDYTYRRMILHYANLCVIAGGVDLFLIGSELHDLEIIRGPAWTPAGTTDADGNAIWDYPFVDGLVKLANDVRAVFDAAGLNKDLSGLHNLISYTADWSDWMGIQQPASPVQNNVPSVNAIGQFPHLDQLYGSPNVDLVCFDNYLPISDWTTGSGGLDAIHWAESKPTSWPPSANTMNGLGLTGAPTIYSMAYLKANIEGGEKFNWFYRGSNNLGFGLDPNGSNLQVSLCNGDRVIQNRQPYFPNQQLLANKNLRWWWSNSHQAIYDSGDGAGWSPHGPTTKWAAQSKSISFPEYGFPSCDRATNQPNMFYDSKSTESGTPYWSIWVPVDGAKYAPKSDQLIQLLALQAVYEYWITDGNNMSSGAGLKMIEPSFMSVWNWDARPFPAFPTKTDVWGDAGNWAAGDWLGGKGPFITPPLADPPPPTGKYAAFPILSGQGWSLHYKPHFATSVAEHVSGRQSHFARMSAPIFEIEIAFDLLRMDGPYLELQTLLAFIKQQLGQKEPFTFPSPAAFGLGSALLCRFADDVENLEEFMAQFWEVQAVKLRTVKGE
jgi:hypothetical protein